MAETEGTILGDIKHLIGPSESSDYFDVDLLIHINATMATLYRLGVGADRNVPVEVDKNTTWSEITGDDPRRNCIKQYVYLKTRIAFDPPTSSFVLDAMKQQIEELEWQMRAFEETPALGGTSPSFDYDNYRYDESSKRWVDGDES